MPDSAIEKGVRPCAEDPLGLTLHVSTTVEQMLYQSVGQPWMLILTQNHALPRVDHELT